MKLSLARRSILFLLPVFIMAAGEPSLAAQASRAPESEADQLLLADTPIAYGEELFAARIAERSQGREPVGLVLSGGSARAFAHIGVLRRLEEAGVVPDFIVTNSMGSIVGLLYAAGLSPDQIERLMESTDLSALYEPVVPLTGGVLDPARFSDLIRHYLGDLRLEDLPIPVMVACEDLRTKREIRIMEGPLVTVLEASYALPVFFPPVAYGKHLLVDGGLTNLVPLGLAMRYSSSVIVSSTFYDASGVNLRNPLVVLSQSIDIGKRRAGVADILAHPQALWIRCDVEDYSFMAFDRLKDLVADGYRSANAQSPHLAAYGNGGVPPALAQARQAWEKKLARAEAKWAPFSRAPASPYLGLAAALGSTAFPGDRYYLSDELSLTASAAARWGIAELSLGAGAVWEAYRADVPRSAAIAQFTLYPLSWLRITSSLRASWESLADQPALYHHGGLEARFPAGPWTLALASALEGRYLEEPARLLSSETGLSFGDHGLDLEARVGHQLETWSAHSLWAKAGATVPLLPPLGLSASGAFRLAFDGTAKGYESDGLLVASGGFATAAWYTARAGLSLAPESLSLSLAELIILRKFRLGAWFESLWAAGGGYPAAMAPGLCLSLELSLIGLKSTDLFLEAAWELTRGRPLFRLYVRP